MSGSSLCQLKVDNTNMSSADQSRFFGLDLQSFGRELQTAWHQIQGWPVLNWLAPAVPVRLLRSDGQDSLWLLDGASGRPCDGNASTARFAAVELPEDDLLRRKITLPALTSAEVAQAVALDVAGASPFPPEDTVWGYSTRQADTGKLEIQIALASRKRIADCLERAAASARPQDVVPEVWAMAGDSPPIVFGGFGETQRQAHAAVRTRVAFALVLLALGLAACIAATPVAQARLRAMEAAQASDVLSKRAEPLTRKRAALLRNVESGQALKEVLADRAEPLYVMDLLTRALPDDTSLLSVQVQGSKVAINGSTADAAALMQQLSAHPELREVKAPNPATRPLGAAKDSFSIEFTVANRPAPSAVAPVAAITPAPAAAPAASSSAATGSPPPLQAPVSVAAPQPATQAAPQAAPQPPPRPANQSGASFGGATFGAPTQPAKAP
jgi:general secretion pathway protein L